MKLFLFLCSLLLAAGAAAQQREVPASIPPASIPDENILNLDLSTGGRVVLLLRPDIAPKHVERIRTLANRGFYDGQIFHRVIPGFMAQTGDPTGTGEGGSDLPDLEPEFTNTPHLRGTLAMARAQAENSANSQFYITFMPRAQLDGEYTVLGRVFSGMEYVDAIAPGEPPETPDRIVQARVGRNIPLPPKSAVAQEGLTDLTSALPAGTNTPAGADASRAEEPVPVGAAPTGVAAPSPPPRASSPSAPSTPSAGDETVPEAAPAGAPDAGAEMGADDGNDGDDAQPVDTQADTDADPR